MPTFENPEELNQAQDTFSSREVGLTHPDVPGFLRIKDNGDIEIVAGEGLSIIMNAASRSITFVADSVKFLTKDEGLRWNKLLFNGQATTFNEPTFSPTEDVAGSNHIYRDVAYFLNEDDEFKGLNTSPAPIIVDE